MNSPQTPEENSLYPAGSGTPGPWGGDPNFGTWDTSIVSYYFVGTVLIVFRIRETIW
jgi:hypothetical protein